RVEVVVRRRQVVAVRAGLLHRRAGVLVVPLGLLALVVAVVSLLLPGGARRRAGRRVRGVAAAGVGAARVVLVVVLVLLALAGRVGGRLLAALGLARRRLRLLPGQLLEQARPEVEQRLDRLRRLPPPPLVGARHAADR